MVGFPLYFQIIHERGSLDFPALVLLDSLPPQNRGGLQALILLCHVLNSASCGYSALWQVLTAAV